MCHVTNECDVPRRHVGMSVLAEIKRIMDVRAASGDRKIGEKTNTNQMSSLWPVQLTLDWRDPVPSHHPFQSDLFVQCHTKKERELLKYETVGEKAGKGGNW